MLRRVPEDFLWSPVELLIVAIVALRFTDLFFLVEIHVILPIQLPMIETVDKRDN